MLKLNPTQPGMLDSALLPGGVVSQLLSRGQIGIWRFDPDKDTYYFSSELDLGWGSSKETPRSMLKLIQHPADGPKDDAIRERLTREGGEAETEMRYRRPDGSWMHLHVLYRSGERLASGLYEMYGISQDITATAEARDQAEAATQAKSAFLASVSHEIRTPLNGVTGVLHLLQREQLSAEARELVDQALASGQMLGQLINDILDFSKIEAGKLEIAPVPTDIRAAVEGVAAMLRPLAADKGLYLRTRLPEQPGWATVDPVRLRQCLFNVTGNAVKFTERGGVEIRLSLQGRGESQRLRFEIADTGVGIPEEAKGRLFERFTQAESGTTRKFGGTGLGLAISRSLARLMGGDMGFESTEGEGSTFWFEMSAPACAEVKSEGDLSQMDAPLEGLTVLVVDDNATNRLVATKTLEAMGAEAVAVGGGHEAVGAVKTRSFDLILMDINMPGMDGLEATTRIRELDGEAAHTPIVAMTADVMTHQKARYYEAGMNGVAPKPFSPAQLLSEIVRILAASS